MTGEELYSLMPLIFWLTPLGPSYILNFGIITCAGQLLKDFVQLPRPPENGCGKIVRLERQHETEYGLPSTHIMGALLPLSMLLNMSRIGHYVSPLFWILSINHIISLGASRLYLGVHSPMDLMAGLLIGTPLMWMIHHIGEPLEILLLLHPTAIAIHLFLIALFLTSYPKGNHWTASYGTSAQFFGSAIGVATAMWYIQNVDPSLWQTLEENNIYSHPLEDHYAIITRVCVGLVVCLCAKAVGKSVSLSILAELYRRGWLRENPMHMRDCAGKDVHPHKLYCVEIPARLVSYSLVAWSVFVFSPLLWRFLGLSPLPTAAS